MAEFILKDWYGKDQTFDKETIYVQGADGELMPFTHGTGSQEIKLQEKTITENGEYTADAGFDGLLKVLVNVAGSGTPGVDLLPKQTFDNFASTPDFGGLYAGGTNFDMAGIEPFALEVGKTYCVAWDGKEYDVVGQDVSAAISNAVALGNCASFGFSGNGEPFALVCISNIGVNFVSIDSQESSHTVRIFKKVNGYILAEPLVVTGTFKPTAATNCKFNHNLGVVPDCVMIRNVNSNNNTVPDSCILYAIGFRTGLRFSSEQQDIIAKTSNGIQFSSNSNGIESTGSSVAQFVKADAESVTVGGILMKMDTTAEYAFVATRITAYE